MHVFSSYVDILYSVFTVYLNVGLWGYKIQQSGLYQHFKENKSISPKVNYKN
jgi:hypothetical protein